MLRKVPNINAVLGAKKTLFDALLGKPVDYARGKGEEQAEEAVSMVGLRDYSGHG